MSTEVERPWVSRELEPSKRKQAISDELRVAFREAWEANPDDFQDKQMATDNDESVNGTVAFDKFDVARLLSQHIRDAHPEWQSASLNPAQIARRIHWAAADAGKDRRSIERRKAEYLAIDRSESIGEVEEPSMNERREVNGSDESE